MRQILYKNGNLISFQWQSKVHVNSREMYNKILYLFRLFLDDESKLHIISNV